MYYARIVRFVLTSLAAVIMIGWCSGCGRKPAPPPQPVTPFQRIMSNLDNSGDLLVVANLDGIIQQFVETVCQDLASVAPADPQVQLAADQARRVNDFLKKNGFYAVRGYGLSVMPRTNGWSTVKSFLSRDPVAATLPLWRGFVGGKPCRQACLNFLPADAALVSASSADINQLWQLVECGVNEVATPEIASLYQTSIATMGLTIGTDIRKLFQSLGEGGFISVQLSKNSNISLPFGSKPLTMPEPSLLIALAVKDDTILKLLDSQFAKGAIPLARKQVGDASLRSMSFPVPLPISVQPTYTMHANYLLFGSSEKAVTDAITAFQQHNGLLATPEFTEAFADLPVTNNNGLVYYSSRFVTLVNDLQETAMTNMKETPGEPGQAGVSQVLLRSLTRWNRMPACSFVTINTDEGILTTGRSTSDAKTMVMQALAAPVGLMAAVAIPSFVKARTTSQKNACINNLRQIESAKDQWAIETGQTNGTSVTMKDLAPYLKNPQKIKCPSGGKYQLNPIGSETTCTEEGHKL